MFRVCLALSMLLALSSCKRQESKPPTIEDTPPSEATAEKATTPTAQNSNVDLYGAELPANATGRLGSLRMVDRSIRQMIFTANGTQAISTHRDGFQLWNLTDASRGPVLPQDNPGELMAVSADGKLLATSIDNSDQVVLWDLESGKRSASLTVDDTLVGLCFIGNQKLATATSGGDIGTWKLGGKGKPKSYSGQFSSVTALACASEAGWLAVGTSDGDAYAMKIGGNKAIKLGSASKAIQSVAIASDGSAFAFGSDDENILLWLSPTPGDPIRIQAHDRLVINVAFSPDNNKLYSTGGDWWFRIWDPKTGDMLEEIPGIQGLDAQLMALSPDGSLIISWSEHGGERGSEAGRWWLWNASSGDQLLEPQRHRKAIQSVAYSPNGKLIATASEDRSIRIWDAKSTKAVEMLDRAEGSINDVAFSADGTSLYSSGVDALLRLWNWESGVDTVPVEGIGGAVNRITISSDGARAFTGDQIGRVWSWDLASGNQIQAYDRQGYSAIYDLALSPDGKLLAIGGSDRVVRIIDTNGGQEVAQLNPGGTTANHALSFSPDGKLLATAGAGEHKIQIWNTADWKQGITLKGHDGTVRCLQFAPSGRKLVSGGNDEMVRVWNLKSGEQIAVFEGHQGVITDVAVSPAGDTIASASRDRSVLLWAMP